MNPALQSSIPLFLAPAFAELGVTSNTTVRSFSSSACHQLRKKRDLNRRRGESVIRSTGPRHSLSVQRSYRELPKPVPEEDRPVDNFPINPNHGLYGFFNKDKETVIPGEKEEQHGRAWAIHELTFKSFEDLHALYWQGLLEINRVKTRLLEHRRLKLGYGSMEADQRLNTVSSASPQPTVVSCSSTNAATTLCPYIYTVGSTFGLVLTLFPRRSNKHRKTSSRSYGLAKMHTTRHSYGKNNSGFKSWRNGMRRRRRGSEKKRIGWRTAVAVLDRAQLQLRQRRQQRLPLQLPVCLRRDNGSPSAPRQRSVLLPCTKIHVS